MNHQPSKAGTTDGVPVQTPGRSQFMVGFMVCVGVCAGWYMGVRPLEQKFKETRAQLAAVKEQLAPSNKITKTEPPLGVVIDGLNVRGWRTNQAAALSG